MLEFEESIILQIHLLRLILDLSKTLCSRKRRVTASQKRCGESKLLYKRIFVMICQANRPLSTANY